MDRRLSLQKKLEELMLELFPGVLPDASAANKYHVYFQPPSNILMHYPAIRYARTNVKAVHADDEIYKRDKQYTVTIMDRNPDSAIPDAVAYLPKARFSTAFERDGLHHDVYTIYH